MPQRRDPQRPTLENLVQPTAETGPQVAAQPRPSGEAAERMRDRLRGFMVPAAQLPVAPPPPKPAIARKSSPG